MPAVKLKWSSLLNISDLEFVPEPPKVLSVSDELLQTISWLTGVTGHDRRLLRCDENGAILTNNGWSNLIEVESAELYPQPDSPDSAVCVCANKGVLVATSTEIIKASFVRVSGGAVEVVYIPPAWLYWYPHPSYSITATVVPASTGTASYVGVTAFN